MTINLRPVDDTMPGLSEIELTASLIQSELDTVKQMDKDITEMQRTRGDSLARLASLRVKMSDLVREA